MLLFAAFSVAAVSLLSNHAKAFAITGISAEVNALTGERPFRLNINELYMSGPGWDLFILALHEFQQLSQDDPLSYYQVAGKSIDLVLGKLLADSEGIHGLPQVPWDGVAGRGDHPGYCVHASVTFPTWHRPYLALFEVSLI